MRRLRDRGGLDGTRYAMREKLLSIGDDSWIETEGGERAFRVNGKALRVRDTLVLENPSGDELYSIQEKKLSVRDRMEIERDGKTVATVKKALVGIRDRYAIDVDGGEDMSAKGNVVDHEYEIERDGERSPRSRRSGSASVTRTASRSLPGRTTPCCWRSPSASTRWAAGRSECGVRPTVVMSDAPPRSRHRVSPALYLAPSRQVLRDRRAR